MITSNSNSRIKYISKLQQKARFRQKEGLFVCEGVRFVMEIPIDLLFEVYVTPERTSDARLQKWLDTIMSANIPTNEVSESVMNHIAMTMHPQGLLAVAKIPHTSLDSLTDKPDSLIICLEHVSDPGNVGTIFRTAEAAGASGVIVDQSTCDCFSPKVVRSTMGSIFRMPCVVADDMSHVISKLSSLGYNTLAAVANADAVSYDTVNYQKSTAIIIGNEGNGLSPKAIAACSESIFIPMQGATESLNASMAAGIILFEAARQRRHADMV